MSPAVQMDTLLPPHHITLQIAYPALTIFGIIMIQNSMIQAESKKLRMHIEILQSLVV
jgi:hypothetical protein